MKGTIKYPKMKDKNFAVKVPSVNADSHSGNHCEISEYRDERLF